MIKIDWTARGTRLGAAMQARIEEQIQRLQRYLQGDANAHVIVTSEGEGAHLHFSVEVVVTHRLGTFASTQESSDLGEAARDSLHRIEAQAHKAHDKMIATRRRGANRSGVPESAEA